MVRIRLPNATEATLEARRWSCSDRRLERLLNAMLAPWPPHRDEADAELKEAAIAAKVLGGRIVEQEEWAAAG